MAALLLYGGSAYGQEALRMSLASEEAAEARRAASQLGYCNIKLGPVSARAQATMGLELSDNVVYSASKPESDGAIRAGVNIQSILPITDLNSLYFSTGLGYMKYFDHGSLDSFYVTPDSALSFQMYSGDFAFNIHDRFAYTESGSQTPTINSIGRFGQIANTAGASVDWDLNKLVLSVGYDHDTLDATDDAFKYIDRSSELFTSRAAFELNKTTKAGINLAGGLTSYDQKDFLDNSYYSVGPFIETRLSRFIRTGLSAGYVDYLMSNGKLAGTKSSLDSYYANWYVTHQATRWMSHTLSLRHELNLGVWYNLAELSSVNYRVKWTLAENLSLITGVSYYEGTAYYPNSREDLNWFSGDIGVSWQINPKLTTSLLYQYSTRHSDNQVNRYNQNRLALSVTYTF